MTRVIITLGLLCASLTAFAHQPSISSTILAEQEEGKWVVQIRAALTAFEYEVAARYGESAFATPEEFRKLVVEYLQKEIILRFNDGTIMLLKDGIVNLGHETTATFQLAGTPGEVTSLTIRNAAFSNISHNQSALYVVKEGFSKNRFLLSDANAHTAKLQAADNEFVLAAASGGFTGFLPFLLFGAFLLLGTLGYLAYGRRQDLIPEGRTLNKFQ